MEFTKNNTQPPAAVPSPSSKFTPAPKSSICANDNWKSGPLPQLKRVIWRMVPSTGNRRALIERGDADVSFDLPTQDILPS